MTSRFAAAVAGGLLTWQGFAYFTRRSHAAAVEDVRVRDEQGRATRPAFAVGSVEDTVADTLQTGDLVFFDHRCSLKLPCDSLHCMLVKQRQQEALAAASASVNFNHVGIIVCRGAAQQPYVLEMSSGGNVSMRRYVERVRRSTAKVIYVHPLRCSRRRGELTRKLEDVYGAAVQQGLPVSLSTFQNAVAGCDASASFVVGALQNMGILSTDVDASRALPHDLFRYKLVGAALRPPIIVRA